MKIPVWFLLVLLACLFSPGRADCQGECVACGVLMQHQQLQQAFNTMVCLLECEGHVSSSLTWDVCKRAVELSRHPLLSDSNALLKRGAAGEELRLTSLDLNSDGGQLLRSAERYREEEEEQVEDQDQDTQTPYEQRSGVQYVDSSLLLGSSSEDAGDVLRGPEDDERDERDAENQSEDYEDDGSDHVTLSKRFGGFQRGRHAYRKLISAPMRLQKRYGGFIGVRKSARKWNSQKRVNQLLRQYLGMRSSRSGRFNNNNNNNNGLPVNRVWRQNKL